MKGPLTTLLLVLAPVFVSAAPRPNVLVIMADDLGWADLGCYGSEIETPVLDQLAADGLRFTQFYNTAKCHSSRISLLTGLYPIQAGDAQMSNGVTFAHTLGASGYTPMMVGKWHLNGSPLDYGFQRYFGHLSGATNFFTGDGTFRLDREPWAKFDDDFYTTTAFVDHALDFLTEARTREKPWLLYVAFNAPHYPLQAPKADVERYLGRYDEGWDVIRERRQAKQRALGVIGSAVTPAPRPDHVPAWETLDEATQDWESRRMAVYAAMVDRMDREIGRLIGDLREAGELENTLILFCSDNGACPFERTQGATRDPWDPKSYWTYDTGWAHVGNTPFRWYKQNQHEGGIRSPLIVHWPPGVKSPVGRISAEPGHLIDIHASLVDIAGATYPAVNEGRAVTPLQGRSLVPIFEGRETTSPSDLYFQFGNNRALRRGDWKVVSFRGGPWELYDLAKDPTELNNLAAAQPQRVETLSAAWRKMAIEVEGIPPGRVKPVKAQPQVWPFERKTWAEQAAGTGSKGKKNRR